MLKHPHFRSNCGGPPASHQSQAKVWYQFVPQDLVCLEKIVYFKAFIYVHGRPIDSRQTHQPTQHMKISYSLLTALTMLFYGNISAQQPNPAKDTTLHTVTVSDSVFTRVEIESQYPGGRDAWNRFLSQNLHYPQAAVNNEIQGMVLISFMVDTLGHVSEVEAVSGPQKGGLREEGVRIIKKSGDWIPAYMSGRKVKSYKKQPFVFKLQVAR